MNLCLGWTNSTEGMGSPYKKKNVPCTWKLDVRRHLWCVLALFLSTCSFPMCRELFLMDEYSWRWLLMRVKWSIQVHLLFVVFQCLFSTVSLVYVKYFPDSLRAQPILVVLGGLVLLAGEHCFGSSNPPPPRPVEYAVPSIGPAPIQATSRSSQNH